MRVWWTGCRAAGGELLRSHHAELDKLKIYLGRPTQTGFVARWVAAHNQLAMSKTTKMHPELWMLPFYPRKQLHQTFEQQVPKHSCSLHQPRILIHSLWP